MVALGSGGRGCSQGHGRQGALRESQGPGQARGRPTGRGQGWDQNAVSCPQDRTPSPPSTPAPQAPLVRRARRQLLRGCSPLQDSPPPQCPAAPTGKDHTPSTPATGPSFCTLRWGSAQQVTRGRRSAKPEGWGRVDGRAAGGQMDGGWVDDGQMDEGGQEPHCCAKTERPHDAGKWRETETWAGGLGAPPPAPEPHALCPATSCIPSCPGPPQLHLPSSNAHRGQGHTMPLPHKPRQGHPQPRRPRLASTRITLPHRKRHGQTRSRFRSVLGSEAISVTLSGTYGHLQLSR